MNSLKTNTMGSFEAKSQSLSKILMGEIPFRNLCIPEYQRDYVWTREEIEQLINDLVLNTSIGRPNGGSEYFSGSVILHDDKQDSHRYIIDGQQRITTCTVALYAFRDILEHCTNYWTGDERNHYGFTVPGMADQKWSLNDALNQISNCLFQSGSPKRYRLMMKQADQPRLEWIQQGLSEKSATFCTRTLVYRDLPARGKGRYHPRIYRAYQWFWNTFALGSEEIPGTLQQRTRKDEYGNDIDVERCHPFNDTRRPTAIEYEITKRDDLTRAIQRILDTSYAIQNFMNVVEISVSDLWTAHLIFDRANSTGVRLTIFDVIRAKLYAQLNKLIGEGSASSEDKQRFDEDLEEISKLEFPPNEMVNFVKHYAIMERGTKLSEQEMKDHFSNQVLACTTGSDLISITQKLARASGVYERLFIRPENHNPQKTRMFSDFSQTKFRQHRPFLMRVAIDEDNMEVLQSIQREIELVYLIHNTIMNARASVIEEKFAMLCADLDSHTSPVGLVWKMYTKTKTFARNGEGVFTKQLFAEKLAEKSDFSAGSAQFILRNIIMENEQYSFGSLHLYEPKKLNLEHILPQTPSKWGEKWWNLESATSTDLHSEFLWKIGNLTLLDRSGNASIGNKIFSKKMAVYGSDSQPMITSEIARKYSEWGEEEIKQRGMDIANSVADIWWQDPFE